jgi:hypothetical protein
MGLATKCMWFAGCGNVAMYQVQHPTINNGEPGWVDCCQAHLDWLDGATSGPKFVPPLVARIMARHPGIEKSRGLLVVQDSLLAADEILTGLEDES